MKIQNVLHLKIKTRKIKNNEKLTFIVIIQGNKDVL